MFRLFCALLTPLPVVSAVGPGEHALPELDILAHLHSLIVLHMVHCNLCLTHKLEAGLKLLREIFININIYIYYYRTNFIKI